MKLITDLKTRSLKNALGDSGFVRSDDRSSEESVVRFLHECIFDRELSIDEVYIARGELFGSAKPYVTYVRYLERRG